MKCLIDVVSIREDFSQIQTGARYFIPKKKKKKGNIKTLLIIVNKFTCLKERLQQSRISEL